MEPLTYAARTVVEQVTTGAREPPHHHDGIVGCSGAARVLLYTWIGS